MTLADISITVFCALVWLALIVRLYRIGRTEAGQRSRAFGTQMRVRYAAHPLRYTALAGAQCSHHGLNREWVETAIAFPDASGESAGNRTIWFVRELGNRQIKVWVNGTLADRSPVVTRVEVTAPHAPGIRMRTLQWLHGRIREPAVLGAE